MDRVKEKRAKRVEPYGTIGGIVNTEWGTFFNIKQKPS
jgi:hypothetical protein